MTNKDKTTVLETDGDLIQAIETMTMPTTRTQVTPPSPHENKLKAPSTCKIASFLTAYEKWVENHTGLARNIEATLYIAPQLIPKSVLEPEIAAQCSYSFVGLLHLYHDYVLWKKQENNYVESPIKQCQKLTRLVRMPLSLIMHVQVLAEVVARKAGGDVGKWRLIVWVEVVKGVLRLMLLSQQRHVMLISGGKYKGIESASRLSAFTRFKKTKQPGARTGKTFGKVTTASKPEPLTKTSDDKDLKTMAFEDATCDVAEASREDLLVAGEICHILRPVMYALLRRRRSETSWTPVVVSLLMELSGLALSAAAVKPTEPMKAVFINKAGDEIAARKVFDTFCTVLATSATDSFLADNNAQWCICCRWLFSFICFVTRCSRPSRSPWWKRVQIFWTTCQEWASSSVLERLPYWTTIISSTFIRRHRRPLLPDGLLMSRSSFAYASSN